MGCARVSQVCVEISAVDAAFPSSVLPTRTHVLYTFTHTLTCMYVLLFHLALVVVQHTRRERVTYISDVYVSVKPAAAKYARADTHTNTHST